MSADQDFYITMSRVFDTLMSDAYETYDVPPFVSNLYSVSSFPPSDVYMDEEKRLNFVLSLAGYSSDSINIETAGDYLIVSGDNDGGEKAGFKILKRGIKRGKFVSKYFVPSSKYDKGSIRASFKDGILRISVDPLPDQTPKKISIDIE